MTSRDMSEVFAREPHQIAELRPTRCKLRHAQAPCQASGPRCYNTIETCGDEDNFSAASRAFSINSSATLQAALSYPNSSPHLASPFTIEFQYGGSGDVQLGWPNGTGLTISGTTLSATAGDAIATHTLTGSAHIALLLSRSGFLRLAVDGVVVNTDTVTTPSGPSSTFLVSSSSGGLVIQLLRVWNRVLLLPRLRRDAARHELTDTVGLLAHWTGALNNGNALFDANGGAPLERTGGALTVEDPIIDEDPQRLRFAMADRQMPPGLDAIPALMNVSVGNVSIEIGKLGRRGTASATFSDFVHDGRELDPYVDERGPPQGTFWPQFRAIQPYYMRREMVIYIGHTPKRPANLARFTAHAVSLRDTYPIPSGATLVCSFVLRNRGHSSLGWVIGNDGWSAEINGSNQLIVTVGGSAINCGVLAIGVRADVDISISPSGVSVTVDGAVAGTGSAPGAISPTNPVTVGRRPGDNDRLANIDIADIRIRSANILRQSGKRLGGRESNLIGYWPLYEDWTDYSGQGNDGELLIEPTLIEDCREWQHPPFDSEDILDSMTSHTFLMDEMRGPDKSYQVTIAAKDPVTLTENDKALYPPLSRGELSAALAEGDGPGTNITISLPSGVGVDDEYPSGTITVRIGREHIQGTRSAASTTFTVGTRGFDNTEIASHDASDVIQRVEYPSDTVDQLLILLLEAAKTPAKYIPHAEFAAEQAAYLPRIYSSVLSTPTAIKKLIEELILASSIDFWFDNRRAQYQMRALKPPPASRPEIADRDDIQGGSIEVADYSDDIITQAWVFFGQIDPTENLDKLSNYRAGVVVPRLSQEGEPRLRSSKIETIPTRWISSSNAAAAAELGQNLLRRLGGIPFRVRTGLDYSRAKEIWTGDVFTLNSRVKTDFEGLPKPVTMQVLDAGHDKPGHSYNIMAQDYVFSALPDDDTNLIEIAADINNVNLRQLHDELFATIAPKVRCVIFTGVVIGSNSTLDTAFDVGFWPPGVEITIEIQGTAILSGAGGKGGNAESGQFDGTAGGTGLFTRTHVLVVNSATVQGGGGGGAADIESSPPFTFRYGGSGGAGRAPGSGGVGQPEGAGAGNAGTLTAGGPAVGSAGAGGDAGQPGQSSSRGAGGSAGVAVDGKFYINGGNGITDGVIIGAQVN